MNSKEFSISKMIQRASNDSENFVSGYCLDGEWRKFTFKEIFDIAVNKIKELNLLAGLERSVVILDADNSLDWLVWDLASIIAEIPIVAVGSNMDVQKVVDDVKKNITEFLILVSQNKKNISETEQISAKIEWSKEAILSIENCSWRPDRNDDAYSYVYSSGSTGFPKGLIVSRLGLELLVDRFINDFEINKNDSTVIFLPLSNFQQRAIFYGGLYAGCDVAISNNHHVFHDIKRYRPSFLIAPPVFYETIKRLGNKSDSLSEVLGGNIRFLITGMAPIKYSTLEEFQKSGLNLFEVYGMTEAGMICWNTPFSNEIGTVGKEVVPGAVKINKNGEILVKSTGSLCKGYFNLPNDEEMFSKEKYIKTGDIGRFDSNERLVLFGRKKNILISSTGEKKCAEEIEKVICKECDLEIAFIVSGKLKEYCLYYVSEKNNQKIDKNKKIQKIINKIIPGLNVCHIVEGDTAPSYESGTLLPNMKPDRGAIYQNFIIGSESVKERMYD